jgi:chitin synthase
LQHIITCFVQYMLFLPAMINVLGIYSFANLHDVSWGNRPAEAAKNLGGASKKEGKDVVEVDLPTAPKDIDSLWVACRKDLSVPEKEVKVKRDSATKQKDHMANFRTNVMLAYLGSNMALVLFFTSQFFLRWIRKSLDLEQVRPPESLLAA